MTSSSKKFFFKSSAIVLSGTMMVNLFNYLFNVLMGRLLTPSQFGEVAALISLIYLLGIPSVTLQTYMAKHTFPDGEKLGKIFFSASSYVFVVGVVLTLIFWFVSPVVAKSLKISWSALVVCGLLLPLLLANSLNSGTLQGLHKFGAYSFSQVIISAGKLALALVFVFLGIPVLGAMISLVTSSFVAYVFGFSRIKPHLKSSLREFFRKNFFNFDPKKVYSNVAPTFWTTLFLTAILSFDVVLAKLFLSPFLAGQYAALALTAKTINFFSAGITTVMFPLVSAATRNESPRGKADEMSSEKKQLLRLSLLLTLTIAAPFLFAFAFLPELLIRVLISSKYLLIAPYLLSLGIAVVINTLASNVANYLLASNIKKYLIPLGVGIIGQTTALFFFHQTIKQIVLVQLVFSTINFLSLGIIFKFEKTDAPE